MSDIAATIPPAAPTSNTDPAAVAAAIATPGNGLTTAPVIATSVPVVSVKAPNTTFARYATAILTALITIGSASQILPAHHTTQDLVQFGIIVAGAIGTIFSYITAKGPWPGVFKTGFAVLAVIGTILVPYLANGASFTSFTATTWIVIGVAVAQAIATEIGVDYRVNTDAKTEENLLK